MVSIKPTEVIVWDNHSSWKVEKKILVRRDTDKATPDSVHEFSPNLWLTLELYMYETIQLKEKKKELNLDLSCHLPKAA